MDENIAKIKYRTFLDYKDELEKLGIEINEVTVSKEFLNVLRYGDEFVEILNKEHDNVKYAGKIDVLKINRRL